ncbi:hypothetical protein CONPUDRAFT_57043, partial [Coniophora puteana RWD-64-598 SS2]
SSCFDQAVMISVPAIELDIRVHYTPPATGNSETSTVTILHPGAAYSGLPFALAAQKITRLTEGDPSVLSLDPRRRGEFSDRTCINGFVSNT